MSEWNATLVTEFLKAVAHETRLQIVRLLYLHPEEEMSAGVISVELQVPPNLLSFHLKELAMVGVISKNVSGRNVFYAVTPRTRKFVHIFREEFEIRKAPDDEVWVSAWSGLTAR